MPVSTWQAARGTRHSSLEECWMHTEVSRTPLGVLNSHCNHLRALSAAASHRSLRMATVYLCILLNTVHQDGTASQPGLKSGKWKPACHSCPRW